MNMIDFEFADKRLSDFGFIVCHINTDSGLRDVDIGCDIDFGTVKNRNSSKNYITSSSYENVYSVSFDIMKNTCRLRNGEDIYLTIEEIRHLTVWLNRREYRKFKPVNNVTKDMNVFYYGSFNVRQVMLGDLVIGLSLTFKANSPYAFSDEIQLRYDIISENEHFYIHGDSDELSTIYPVVSILCNQSGDIKISNLTSGTYLFIGNCSAGETIVLDGEHKIITSDNADHITLYNDFNYEFLGIQIKDDNYSLNEYEVSLPCEIYIKYSPIRKVGVY